MANPKVELMLHGAILSYPHFLKPHAAVAGGKEKFGGAFLLTAADNKDDLNAILAAKKTLARGAGVDVSDPEQLAAVPISFHKGSIKKPKDEFYADKWIVNAYTDTKPPLVNGDPRKVDDLEAMELFVPGYIVNVRVNLYLYKVPKLGLAFGLQGVQFVRKADRLDNVPDPEDLFDAVAGTMESTGETEGDFDWN